MSSYVNIPASSVGVSDFFTGTKAWAANRVPALATAHLIGTDFLGASAQEYLLQGTAAPTFDTAYSGGVLSCPSAVGSGQIDLGNTSLKRLIASPKGEPWACRTRILQSASVFTNYNSPIQLGNATEFIYIMSIAGSDDNTWFFSLNDGSDHTTSCGTVGTLGASTCPVGAFYTIGMYFTGEYLGVEFNDVPAFAPLSGSQLDHMGTSPMGMRVESLEVTFGLRVDAMALVVG